MSLSNQIRRLCLDHMEDTGEQISVVQICWSSDGEMRVYVETEKKYPKEAE